MALDLAFSLLVPADVSYVEPDTLRGLLMEISQSRRISYVEDDVDVILRILISRTNRAGQKISRKEFQGTI